jgi:HSP20 family molecular chaperone IbpA
MSLLARHENKEAAAYPARAVAPLVDVFENADEVVVVADVPGVAVEQVDLRVENGTLTIQAKQPNREDRGVPALAREYDEVDRARSFRIPDGIDTTRISAEAKNGTLTVHLPKVAAVKPRRIEVKAS